MDQYYTIDRTASAEFKDRGSRFIAYAYPIETVETFKKNIQSLKKEHPKAVHHCFAYRIGTDKNIFRVSDDGEPSGTAGKQILGQIDSKELTDCTVIVVRYFGGTLLGVPGLIHAYKTVTSLVLQTVPVITRQIEASYMLHFEHNEVNEVMRIIKQFNCTVIESEFHLFPFVKLKIPVNRLPEVVSRLKDIRNAELAVLV